MERNEQIDLFQYDFNRTKKPYQYNTTQFDYSINKANAINTKLSQLALKSYIEKSDKAASDLKRKLNLFTFEAIDSEPKVVVFPDIDTIEILKPKPKPIPKIEPQPIEPYNNQQQLPQLQKQQKEEEAKVNQENLPQAVSDRKYQTILLSGADNFAIIKPKIKALVFKEQYKMLVDRIIMTLNPAVFKINEKVDMAEGIQSLSKALEQIFKSNQKDLYIITVDQIVSLVINKAENYLKNTKDKYLYITNVLKELNSSTVISLFFQRIAYSCPYIIPRQFTKRDYPNREMLLQRQGFIEEGEPLYELNSRMENFEYLYFSFLYHNKDKYIEVIVEYLTVLAEIKVNFAIGNGYKVFLNVLGNALKPIMWDKIKYLSRKIDNDLKEEQAKTKISDIKAINDLNRFTIQKYTEQIARGMYTDLFDPSHSK